MIYGSFQYGELTKPPARHIYPGKAASFLVGLVTLATAYYVGFMTCKNVVGWVNKEPVISPIAGESASLK